MQYWDTVTTLAIVFTAFVTPYEIAFLPMATSLLDVLFLINRCMDAIFVADMLCSFRLMYSAGDGEENASLWVDDPRRIAVHYLKGWFVVDLISIGVSALDIVGLAQQGTSLSSLRVLRTLRALRLIKLIRLLRASRILKRWETRLAINYSALEATKCFVGMVICSHWFACVWTLQASLLSPSVLDSWLGNTGYCEALVEASAVCPAGRECRADAPGVACHPGASIYAASVYWAVMTITSIGYGDIGATPQNAPEQLVCTVLMLLGAALWGYVIGNFCGLIANLSPATHEFRRNMDDLNAWMARHAVATPLRTRLREYFHQTRHLYDSTNASRLLTLMSPMLQSEVVLAVSSRWLRKVWFLSGDDVEPEFLVRLTLALSPMVLAPGELAPCGFLYILSRGVVVLGGEILTKGGTWGEDIILADVAPGLMRKLNAKALHYAEVHIIAWEHMREAAESFPTSARHVRRCCLRLAMRRQLVRAAAAVKRLNVSSALEVSFKTAESALTRSNTRGQQAGSFKRAKTLHKMLGRSTTASDAEINLQTQLINSRQSRSGSLSSGSICSPVSSPALPMASAPAAAQGTSAMGWERRAPPAGTDRSGPVGGGDDSSDDDGSAVQSSAASGSSSRRAAITSVQASTAATGDPCNNATRLDKLTEIVGQQAAAIFTMSQELAALRTLMMSPPSTRAAPSSTIELTSSWDRRSGTSPTLKLAA